MHGGLTEATRRQRRLRVLGILKHTAKARKSQLDVWRPEVRGPHPGPPLADFHQETLSVKKLLLMLLEKLQASIGGKTVNSIFLFLNVIK